MKTEAIERCIELSNTPAAQVEALAELAALTGGAGYQECYEACVEFVRKCDCGEARSTRSYMQMSEAIAKVKALASPAPVTGDCPQKHTPVYLVSNKYAVRCVQCHAEIPIVEQPIAGTPVPVSTPSDGTHYDGPVYDRERTRELERAMELGIEPPAPPVDAAQNERFEREVGRLQLVAQVEQLEAEVEELKRLIIEMDHEKGSSLANVSYKWRDLARKAAGK